MKQFPTLPSIQVPIGKQIYFASDFHLGIPTAADSLLREKLICQWLQTVAKDAHHIFLLGDMFDAWIEYKTVVPKGYVRLLGLLANLTDSGIAISFFTGNHDLWMYGYFQQELNIPVYHTAHHITINSTSFLLGHGDGLGPKDASYKALKYFLRHPACQWLYARLHPNFGLGIANYFSKKGLHKKNVDSIFLGEDKEFLIQFCKEYVEQFPTNYFVFGHRHFKLMYAIKENSSYCNLGDWLSYNSYAVFNGETLVLQEFTKKDGL
jgi:UDP-2,3-diacylglucosamine hydrolase